MVRIRLALPEDRSLLEGWLSEDTFHKAVGVRIEDAYAAGTWLFIVEDTVGPVMAVRLGLKNGCLHAGAQFNPRTPFRSARAGKAVRDWLLETALIAQLKGVTVKPGGKAIPFVKKLGFSSAGDGIFWHGAERNP